MVSTLTHVKQLVHHINGLKSKSLKKFNDHDVEEIIKKCAAEKLPKNANWSKEYDNFGKKLKAMPRLTALYTLKWVEPKVSGKQFGPMIQQFGVSNLKKMLTEERRPYHSIMERAKPLLNSLEKATQRAVMHGIKVFEERNIQDIQDNFLKKVENDSKIDDEKKKWAKDLVTLKTEIEKKLAELKSKVYKWEKVDMASQRAWQEWIDEGKLDLTWESMRSMSKLWVEQAEMYTSFGEPMMTPQRVEMYVDVCKENSLPQAKALAEHLTQGVLKALQKRVDHAKRVIELFRADPKQFQTTFAGILEGYSGKVQRAKQKIAEVEKLLQPLKPFQAQLKKLKQDGIKKQVAVLSDHQQRLLGLVEKLRSFLAEVKELKPVLEENVSRLSLECKFSEFDLRLLEMYGKEMDPKKKFIKAIDSVGMSHIRSFEKKLSDLEVNVRDVFISLSKRSDQAPDYKNEEERGLVQKVSYRRMELEKLLKTEVEEEEEYPDSLKIVEKLGMWVTGADMRKEPFNYDYPDWELLASEVVWSEIEALKSKAEFLQYYKAKKAQK